MLKEICFIKTLIFLFVLSVSSSDDYNLPKDGFFEDKDHTSSFNKDSNIFLQQNIYNDDDLKDINSGQRMSNELLDQLKKVLTVILRNPDYVHHLTNIRMPVYNVDVRPAENFNSENVSLILRGIAKSKEKNDKKASDSSESSESDENDKKNLRYETCEHGRKKCVKACKSSYREACYLETCDRSLRRTLRKLCKKSCRRWFI